MKKTAKIIFLSDSHLGFDYPIKPRKSLPHRGTDFFDNFKKVLNHAKESKADLVLHGGDLFFRSKVPKKIIKKVYDIILDFAKEGIPLCIVPGNHEKSELPNEILLSHKNIHIFNEPKIEKFSLHNIDIEIGGFPYIRHIREEFSNVQKSLNFGKKSFKVLLNHQTFSGAKVEHYTFRYGKDVIDIKQLSDIFDLVLCGHIHRFQILDYKASAQKRIPIIYPGSIERTSFQEVNEAKGFVELCIMQDHSFHADFIKLPTRPMHMIEVDSTWNRANFLGKVKESIAHIREDSIIRFIPKDRVNQRIKQLFGKDNLYKVVPKSIIIEVHSKLYKKRKKR